MHVMQSSWSKHGIHMTCSLVDCSCLGSTPCTENLGFSVYVGHKLYAMHGKASLHATIVTTASSILHCTAFFMQQRYCEASRHCLTAVAPPISPLSLLPSRNSIGQLTLDEHGVQVCPPLLPSACSRAHLGWLAVLCPAQRLL